MDASIRTNLVNFSEYLLRCKATRVLQAVLAAPSLGHLFTGLIVMTWCNLKVRQAYLRKAK